MNIQKIKASSAKRLASAIEVETKKLLKKSDVKTLVKYVDAFIEDGYNDSNVFSFDEEGFLTSSAMFDLPTSLIGIDDDLLNSVMDAVTGGIGGYEVARDSITITQCIGDVVTVNFSDRRCYAIHSKELGLRVNETDLIGDDDSEKLEHALYLIEITMRKKGYFPGIAEVDYNGQFVRFLQTELGNFTDDQLQTERKRVCKIDSDSEGAS